MELPHLSDERTRLPFYSPELDRTEKFDIAPMEQLVSLLRDERLLELARSGNLSLAMIRPSVGEESNVLRLSDTDAADEIENQIENLGVVAKFSFMFDDETIETFYEGPSKDSMKNGEPRRYDEFTSKWDEFRALMTSGPTTGLLLYSPDDAIEIWRSHLGHWNIEKTRDQATIRGRLGVDNYNNLVHGSDAPDSVVRELDLIAGCIESNIEATKSTLAVDLLGANLLTDANINPSIVEIVSRWEGKGSETYTACIAAEGIAMIAKACIKFDSNTVMEEWIGRRKILSDSGVETPVLYGRDRAVILEEYIPYDFREAYKQADEMGKPLLAEKFIETYKRIVGAGFNPVSLHDVRSHGNDVVVVDFGSDLGGVFTSSPDRSVDALTSLAESELAKILR